MKEDELKQIGKWVSAHITKYSVFYAISVIWTFLFGVFGLIAAAPDGAKDLTTFDVELVGSIVSIPWVGFSLNQSIAWLRSRKENKRLRRTSTIAALERDLDLH